jgi:hypothetical protein
VIYSLIVGPFFTSGFWLEDLCYDSLNPLQQSENINHLRRLVRE